MAFKYMVESNSDKPPDKNMMPAVSGGSLQHLVAPGSSDLTCLLIVVRSFAQARPSAY